LGDPLIGFVGRARPDRPWLTGAHLISQWIGFATSPESR
jgi:hypothetical protein